MDSETFLGCYFFENTRNSECFVSFLSFELNQPCPTLFKNCKLIKSTLCLTKSHNEVFKQLLEIQARLIVLNYRSLFLDKIVHRINVRLVPKTLTYYIKFNNIKYVHNLEPLLLNISLCEMDIFFAIKLGHYIVSELFSFVTK